MSNSRAARSTMLRCPLSSLHTLEQPRAAPLLTRPLSLEPTAPPAASSRALGAASSIAAGAAPASSRAPGVVPSSSRAGKAFSRAAAQRGSRRVPPVPRERRRVPPAPARRRAGGARRWHRAGFFSRPGAASESSRTSGAAPVSSRAPGAARAPRGGFSSRCKEEGDELEIVRHLVDAAKTVTGPKSTMVYDGAMGSHESWLDDLCVIFMARNLFRPQTLNCL